MELTPEVAEILNAKVDGVNVTDQQSAVMRPGSLSLETRPLKGYFL
jgi:hypothetical protein